MIRIRCPHCKAVFPSGDEQATGFVSCSNCKRVIKVLSKQPNLALSAAPPQEAITILSASNPKSGTHPDPVSPVKGLSYWSVPFVEFRNVISLTSGQFFRLVCFGFGKLRQRCLLRSVSKAQRGLGARVLTTGGDYVQMQEYERAVAVQATLTYHLNRMDERRRNLFPTGIANWCRLLVGCLFLIGAGFLFPLLLMPTNTHLPYRAKDHASGSPSTLPEHGSLSASQPPGTSIVFAEGVGASANEALKDAFRHAVQRVVGVFVDSETLIKNDAIISDQVLTFSDGAITKYEELNKTENNGICRVKIKAAVESRSIAARLEAIHISVKAVDLTNVVADFSKQIQADLDKLANEVTDKEAKENARKLLEKDLLRLSRTRLIQGQVVGEVERGNRVGNNLQVRIKVRYEVNKAAYQEAMAKLRKSLLMNASSSGSITFLATPDLHIKRTFQSSIDENTHKAHVVLVNTGIANEAWRTHWTYYILPEAAAKNLWNLCENRLKVKLSLLAKDGQVVAVDEFIAINNAHVFIWADMTTLKYTNQPFDKECYFVAPFFFQFGPDIHYSMTVDQVREFPLAINELKLIQSVRCELFQR